jgi:hypothetical protein
VGEVVDINPADRLVARLRRQLECEGWAQQDHDELCALGVDADQWRRAARRAARSLGRVLIEEPADDRRLHTYRVDAARVDELLAAARSFTIGTEGVDGARDT